MFTISGVENIKIVFGREAKSLKNGTPTFLGVQYQSVSFGRPHKQTKVPLSLKKCLFYFIGKQMSGFICSLLYLKSKLKHNAIYKI